MNTETKYNLIVYSKELSQPNYNRVYCYNPTTIQVVGCIRKFLKRRNTNRYNGYDIFEIRYLILRSNQ